MPPSATRHCLLISLLSALIALAPQALSQEIRMAEARAHFENSFHDLVRKKHLDLATETRLRDEVRSGFLVSKGSLLDRQEAQHRLASSLERGQFGLRSHRAGLEIMGRPEKEYDFALRQSLSQELVDFICSDIRRRSIVDEIGSGSSEKLDHAQLGRYLKDSVQLHDHTQVRDSFDSTHTTEVVTLKQDTVLLRLYGGEAKPLGRYFFCCLNTASILDPHFDSNATAWSDASGLALPPGNTVQSLALVTIPAGTKIIVGTVADNFADQFGKLKPGGNAQIFVPNVKASVFQSYLIKGTNFHPFEIAILTDQGILRYRREPAKFHFSSRNPPR